MQNFSSRIQEKKKKTPHGAGNDHPRYMSFKSLFSRDAVTLTHTSSLNNAGCYLKLFFLWFALFLKL